ncbi:hypothetical protein G8C36_19465 [Gordonia terrae]|nr:hypothetical protein G8C36_19465 [Gordonia terrae]
MRVYERYVGGESPYPRTWIANRAKALLADRVMQKIPWRTVYEMDSTHTAVLYPLHDERDFQVAVRERHAVPQTAFLDYVASQLPAGHVLYIKPHPEHLTPHHSFFWRGLLRRPNVAFLHPSVPGDRALRDADIVLTLASSMGYEALKLGKPVVCYGRPFYSGRTITIDVKDLRDIRQAVVQAESFVPDDEVVGDLIEDVHRVSWNGSFTPLKLDSENLRQMALAVEEQIDSRCGEHGRRD